MGSWNDVEITGVLVGGLIGVISAFLSMVAKLPFWNRGKLVRIGGGLLLGLVVGLIAVQLTRPLEGCSVIKAKDSNFYLVWGTDGVMVRTVAICGIVGAILGTLGQWVHERIPGPGKEPIAPGIAKLDRTDSPATAIEKSASGEGSEETWNTVLVAGFMGLLGGALLIGLPATFIVSTVRAMKGLP